MKKTSDAMAAKRKTSRRKRRQTTEETSCDDEEKDVPKVTRKQQFIDLCERFARSTVKLDIAGMKQEFEALKRYVPPDCSFTFYQANKAKNRYNDIPCLDKTRVVLKAGGSVENDYIHANFISPEAIKLKNKYICTQGPLDTTCLDFWRMVIQEGIVHIVMLCKLVELNKPKCAAYYPINLGENKTIGNISITNVGERNPGENKQFQTFAMSVSNGASPDLQIFQYRCIDWPDFGVPETGLGILRMLREIRRSTHPCLVHCSAGVGRTGTMVAIEIGMRCLLERKEPKVFEIVKELRQMRYRAVQTEGQYIFIYYALMEFAKTRKHFKEIDEFMKSYKDYVSSTQKQSEKHVAPHVPTASPVQEVSVNQQITATEAGQNPSIK